MSLRKNGCFLQDEVDKLDEEIANRHAQELADLQRRQSSTEASNGPEADVMQLADSLYDTKLSAGAEKVRQSCFCLAHDCDLCSISGKEPPVDVKAAG